jgi:hypothetical protein
MRTLRRVRIRPILGCDGLGSDAVPYVSFICLDVAHIVWRTLTRGIKQVECGTDQDAKKCSSLLGISSVYLPAMVSRYARCKNWMKCWLGVSSRTRKEPILGWVFGQKLKRDLASQLDPQSGRRGPCCQRDEATRELAIVFSARFAVPGSGPSLSRDSCCARCTHAAAPLALGQSAYRVHQRRPRSRQPSSRRITVRSASAFALRCFTGHNNCGSILASRANVCASSRSSFFRLFICASRLRRWMSTEPQRTLRGYRSPTSRGCT